MTWTTGSSYEGDLHRLFDLGYVTVTPDYLFRVGNRLREEFKNGRSYYELNNTRLEVPPERCCSRASVGAEGWTRTSTPLREGDFKP